MKILDNDNVIIDFYFSGTFTESVKREVEFLECFLSGNNQMVFMELGCNLYPKPNSEITGVSEDIRRIVLENIVLKTKEKLFDLYYETEEDEWFYWFAPKTKEEIIKIVEHDFYDYICIILEKGKELIDYDYLLDKIENLTFGDYTTTAVVINEKIENSFRLRIQSKIEKLMKR